MKRDRLNGVDITGELLYIITADLAYFQIIVEISAEERESVGKSLGSALQIQRPFKGLAGYSRLPQA